MSDPYVYPDPVQGDATMKVTRQRGIDPEQQEREPDPMALGIVQGAELDIFATRQTGLPGAQRILGGVLHTDHLEENGTLYADRGNKPGESNPPPAPALASGDVPVPPRATTFDDVPTAAAAPPAQVPIAGGPPVIITAAQVAAAKAARPPAPQVVLPSDVPAKPTAKRAKAAKKGKG